MLTWAILVGVAGMMGAAVALSWASSADLQPASWNEDMMPELVAMMSELSEQAPQHRVNWPGTQLTLHSMGADKAAELDAMHSVEMRIVRRAQE